MWPFFNSSFSQYQMVFIDEYWCLVVYECLSTDYVLMDSCGFQLSQLVESWYLMIFMDKLSPKKYLIDEYSGYWLMVVYHSKSWSDFKSIILAALMPTPAPLEEPSHLQGPPEDQKRWIFTQENEGKTMQFIGHLSVISGVIFLWD